VAPKAYLATWQRRPKGNGGPNLHIIRWRRSEVFNRDGSAGDKFSLALDVGVRPIENGYAIDKEVRPGLSDFGSLGGAKSTERLDSSEKREKERYGGRDSDPKLDRIELRLPIGGIPRGNGGGPLRAQIAALAGLWIAAWVGVAFGLWQLLSRNWRRGLLLLGGGGVLGYIATGVTLTH
jgi:hypothetical protein